MNVEYPIQLIVDIEEVATSGTYPMKARRRLQIEEIVDNSLDLVPLHYLEVEPIQICIPEDIEQEMETEVRYEVCTEKEVSDIGLGEDKVSNKEVEATEVGNNDVEAVEVGYNEAEGADVGNVDRVVNDVQIEMKEPEMVVTDLNEENGGINSQPEGAVTQKDWTANQGGWNDNEARIDYQGLVG